MVLPVHGKGNPVVAVEMMAHGGTHEVIAPLGVPSRVKGNDPSSVGSHQIVMFFMYLDVL